ncbi:uncharacterized protein LOC110823974, partial [Carica papaya]|uniref:uncharacterized protein LOC110823974 n=1 Tax=Carica papaya TaxID=3649 RepID=UPI000B8C9197
MKKRNPSTVIAFIIFVVVLTVIHLNVFLFTSSSLKDSVISQGKHLEFRKLDTHEGEVMKDPFPPQIHFRSPDKKKQINCDRFHKNYDVCSINNRFILDPVVSTFYLVDLTSIQSYVMEKIKPYPRKWDETVMLRINELKITSTASGPKCQTQHDLPALVFSAGGYTGNFFHDFNDGFIPLFITVNSIFPDQDFIFVISKANDWWIRRYTELLRAFSLHPIIDLDNDTSTHCFPNANIGLISHGFMTI